MFAQPLADALLVQLEVSTPFVMGSVSELWSNLRMHQNVATMLVICLGWKMELWSEDHSLLVTLLEKFPPEEKS